MDDEKDLADGEPKEETVEEKTSEKNEEPKDEGKKEDKSSAIAQKKHWREKAQNLEKELAELKAQYDDKLQKLQKQGNLTDDEAEKKAQEYIDSRINKLLSEKESKRAKEEQKAIEEFDSELEEVLEENPDVTEKEILDLTEEFLKQKTPISPKQAIAFLKHSRVPKKEKPNIPTPKRASPETNVKEERPTGGDFWKVTERLLKKVRTES